MSMKKQVKSERKYCGNCNHHNAYRFPDKIFCMFHFLKQKNPIYSTLDVCENWEPDYQECFCVQESLKKQSQCDDFPISSGIDN